MHLCKQKEKSVRFCKKTADELTIETTFDILQISLINDDFVITD